MNKPSKLKVLHTIGRLEFGGIQGGTIKVVNHIDRAIFQPLLVSLRGFDEALKNNLAPDVEFVVVRRKDGRDWGLVRKLADFFVQHRVDIVHSHNWETWLYSFLAAQLARVPVFIHGEHGLEAADLSERVLKRMFKIMLASQTDHFTTVSQDITNRIEQQWWVKKQKITVTPNGIDLGRFCPPRKREECKLNLGFDPTCFLIGTVVGRFTPVKDFPTLFRAFSIVNRQNQNTMLAIIGEGESHDKHALMELAVALDISSALRFLKPSQEVEKYAQAFDVYANSSVYEGMSNTLLEAMGCGAAIVATRVGGTPFIVSDRKNGLLVEPQSPAKLAAAIGELITSPPLRARLVESARQYVEHNHSIITFVRQHEEIYKRLYFRKSSGRKSREQHPVLRDAVESAL